MEARANINIANRLSGAKAAGVTYVYAGGGGSGDFNVQTGNNATTYYPGSPSATDGNNLLAAGGTATVQLDLPINLDLAGDHVIAISFDMYWNSGNVGIALSNVLESNGWVNNSADQFGFLKLGANTVQEFNAGTGANFASQTSALVGTYATSTWTIVLSDVASGTGTDAVAGTGSAFGGNGTYVALYYGDTEIYGGALTHEFGDQTLYLGFSNYKGLGAFDNLSITSLTAVPEPASLGYLVAAGLGFVALAARRRSVVRG